MPNLNRWTLRARVARVERERPDLEHSIVKGLYKDYFEAMEREPSLDEFREYVHEITSTIEWRDLHDWYSRHESMGQEAATALEGPAPVDATYPARTAEPPAGGRRRRPGRPGWTAELFWPRYRDAIARTQPPHSYRSLALQFQTLDGPRGIDPDHLRELVKRFGLPPG